MKISSLLAVAALATCSAGAAMAADLPMRSPPPAPYYAAPLFTWTGFYAGVNAGADFAIGGGHSSENGFAPIPGAVASGFGPFGNGNSGVGFVGGGQIGYNIQNGLFVYGIEADIDYLGSGKTSRTSLDNNVFAGGSLTTSGKGQDGYLGTVRGRLGVAAFDRTLLYVTGGLAYGDYGSNTRLAHFASGVVGAPGFDFTNSSGSSTRIGYALGAGVEYAFTQNISGRLEYLYTNIGSRTYNLTNPTTPAFVSVKTDGSAQIARVGLNYKF